LTADEAREFIDGNHRAVLITRRAGGGVQSSPVTIGTDTEGRAVISTRETAYKTRNLRRDPAATVCVFPDAFFGRWIQVEGTAEIVSLPDAMEPLVEYYRRVAGEHPDWDEYRQAMEDQRRVLLRISIDRVGPTMSG
jgi:PPOX class probable F420-dependent enzyme